MNLFFEIHTAICTALDAMTAEGQLPAGLDFAAVSVEPPRDPSHGDMACNAAMVLAKKAGLKPRDLAQSLAEKLTKEPRIKEVMVAGPGFLNLHLADHVWRELLPQLLAAGPDYGRIKIGQGQRINVEYVSANPTGPLHVGHTRGAVFGDALANLLAYAGYEVTREYYINDGGGQVDTLARSAYLRYLEAHGRKIEFPDGTYPGEYLIAVGQALKEKFGDQFVDAPEADWLGQFRNFASDEMMALIRSNLASLGVKMDVYFSEKSLYQSGKIEAALASLDEKGLIYEGVLEPPKGNRPEDWEPREQTLFRSTAYGDDVDRPLKKSDGSWTYFAPDVAYHHDKVTRDFDALIDIFGADHGGYVKRMQAAVAALSDGQTPLDIKLCQLVRLFKGGEPFKMSKRAGNFVLLSDVVNEVGPDVTRFVMLTRKNDAPLDFDFVKALEQSRDNPVFYVQYAHARVHSLFVKAQEAGIATDAAALQGATLASITSEAELALIRKIAEWPRLVAQAAQAHEPHRVAFYLYELAQIFHALWTSGTKNEDLRFIQEQKPAATVDKLVLARAVAVVISSGLGILGVKPVEEMR